jgi:hypothetical protein
MLSFSWPSYNMDVFDFNEQLKKGQLTEQLFMDIFTRKGHKVAISDDQQKGDLIINGEYVEIKTDTYGNDKYLFELLHLDEKKRLRPGWFIMPHYDHLLYYKKEKPGQYLYFSRDKLNMLYQDYYNSLFPGRFLCSNNADFKTLNFWYLEQELIGKKLAHLYKLK